MDIVNLKEKPHYLNKLAQWQQNEWQDLNPGLTLENRIKKMQAYLNSENIPSTFVANQLNKPIGSAAIVMHDLKTRTDLSPWLASVFVNPDYRNTGVGTKLVVTVMDYAKSIGIRNLYLFTLDEQLFYERLHWSHLATETYQNNKIKIMTTRLNNQ